MSAAVGRLTGSVAGATWDVVVIGAGPAGALAAHQLATRGCNTLLVEAKPFPRPKICGGCLNHRGIAELESIGLAHILHDAPRIHFLHCIVGRQSARFPLPETRAVDRAAFDAALVNEAVRAGATFLDRTTASVTPLTSDRCRHVVLSSQFQCATVSARVVVVADGLSRASLRALPEFRTRAAAESRIGVGATLSHERCGDDDAITMIVGRHGYVGLAHCGRGRMNLAAALAPAAVASSSVRNVVERLFDDASVTRPAGLGTARWHGTPPLTSRPSRAAAERLFVIGDASGYVEPFSGEGMSTALETAISVAPLAASAARGWRSAWASDWQAIHRRLVVRQQTTCRQLAWLLRRPLIAAAAVAVCRAQPRIARRVISAVSC